jgi:hypothetical protein
MPQKPLVMGIVAEPIKSKHFCLFFGNVPSGDKPNTGQTTLLTDN